MNLRVEYVLDQWDGPTEFFATLDEVTVWVECDMTGLQKDNRRFVYWVVQGGRSLAASLSAAPSGTFSSVDVGNVV